MEKTEVLEKLNELLKSIEAYDVAKGTYQSALRKYKTAKEEYPSRLSQFDQENEEKHIERIAGKQPVKPKGVVKLAVPVYLAKKAKYEKELEEYKRKRYQAEVEYRKKYSTQRQMLKEQDAQDKESTVLEWQMAVENAKAEMDARKAIVDKSDLFSSSLKEQKTIRTIIGYFEDQRVDTLKEAVNLWYDEKRKDEEQEKADAHRKKILELEEEKVRAAQATEKYVQKICEEVKDEAFLAAIRQLTDDSEE